MKAFIDKLVALEKEISEEKDAFSLFALFQREDAPDRWDLIVSAPWFSDDQKKTLDFLAHRLRQVLKPQELICLSRIVPVSPSDPFVKAIQNTFHVEHGMAEVLNSTFFGMSIQHAFIITSQRKARDNKPVPA